MDCDKYISRAIKLAAKGVEQLAEVPMKHHLIIGLCIRLLFVVYGSFHDEMSIVKYTDVDYRVYTDAARHVLKGESPYERHTYRYSPIIAWLMLPNVFLHESFGKVLFSVVDIMISLCIKSFIQRKLRNKVNGEKVAKCCSLFWLYNPFSIGISTRGNADSISCLLILLSIYFLQVENLPLRGNTQYFLSGIFLGVSIHLRLYPIVFSFPMYLSLADHKINRNTSIRAGLVALIIPNYKQLTLAITAIIYFATCTYGMYLIYGYQFIFETYIYHLFRKDTRHNFSLFFYHSYLRMGDTSFDLVSFTSRVFLVILMILLSLAFGANPITLPFALFCQASIMVMYNTVVTSQYFLWFLSLLPLIVQDINILSIKGVTFGLLWICSQTIWLFSAFLLEILNVECYYLLWLASIFFFGSGIAVLYQFIACYSPGHAFGIAQENIDDKDK